MHKRHDQLAKRLLRRIYEPGGTLTTEEEVSPDAQRFDGYLIPGPDLAARTDDLLYRLGARPCAFEIWSDAPGTEEVVDCIRKLLNARHVFSLATPPRPLPYLWIVCAGHPRAALAAVGAAPSADLAPGVHEAPPAFTTGVVVLSQLPETRETLILRLMGAGETRRRALAELVRLPEAARERQIALPVLLEFRAEVAERPARTAEEEELIMQTTDIVQRIKDEGRREGRDEGLREGRDEGLREVQRIKDEGRREGLLEVYRARFGAVPREVQAAIAIAHEPTLAAWFALVATRSAEEIFASVTAVSEE